VELIEGELISKIGAKRPHVSRLTLVREWLAIIFGGQFIDTEAPIDVALEDNPTNEPQPDVIVLNQPTTVFETNPRPPDLRLVVEIADTSLVFDLTTKASLYARAGIVEYWVLDVASRRIVVHRDPQNGHYRLVVVYTDAEGVAPLTAPGRELRVADLLDTYPQIA
jgi:Uma2 family endonuclease